MKIYLFTLLAICLVVLTGCPIPAYYTFSGNGAASPAEFKKGDCLLTLQAAHPWLDSRKKVVIVNASVQNANTATGALFRYSDATLGGASDSFYINYSNTSLNNKNFIVQGDTLRLQPGEKKDIAFYFLSNKDYSKSGYDRSIERDTLVFRMTGLPQKIYFAGIRR